MFNSKVIGQFFKEFGVQFVISIFWALWSANWTVSTDTYKLLIEKFTVSFFILTWFTGQFVRIKKQQTVESNFTKLDTVTQALVKTSEEALGNITGGNSYPVIIVGSINTQMNQGRIIFQVKGQYPLHDLQFRITDVDNPPPATLQAVQAATQTLAILFPNSAALGQQIGLNQESGKVRLNVQMIARNGSYSQQLRLRFANNAWHYAYRVRKGNAILETLIQPGYPDPENIFD